MILLEVPWIKILELSRMTQWHTKSNFSISLGISIYTTATTTDRNSTTSNSLSLMICKVNTLLFWFSTSTAKDKVT